MYTNKHSDFVCNKIYMLTGNPIFICGVTKRALTINTKGNDSKE